MTKKKAVKKKKPKKEDSSKSGVQIKNEPWTCQKCEALNAHDEEECQYCETKDNCCSCRQPWCMGDCEQ